MLVRTIIYNVIAISTCKFLSSGWMNIVINMWACMIDRWGIQHHKHDVRAAYSIRTTLLREWVEVVTGVAPKAVVDVCPRGSGVGGQAHPSTGARTGRTGVAWCLGRLNHYKRTIKVFKQAYYFYDEEVRNNIWRSLKFEQHAPINQFILIHYYYINKVHVCQTWIVDLKIFIH